MNNNDNSTINIIDENKIHEILASAASVNGTNTSSNLIRAILLKARDLKGLTLEETASLLYIDDPELQQELFDTANYVKNEIYGKRIVIFAPLYISNLCTNNCLYCAFRSENKELKRRYLQPKEITQEAQTLIDSGHKRIVLLAGESYPQNGLEYVLKAIENVYGVTTAANNTGGAIRRINVNLAPLTLEEFKELKKYNIGTYQLFQETYHQETYRKVHPSGKKADYHWRLSAMDRAIEAKIDDVGIGALFGLADWRFEILALLQHANYLQQKFGVGPHTISVPRLEPAFGSELSNHPLASVSDNDFCKIIAILRLAVPYTGIIMSTRETPELRRITFALGVSQISAGSCTNPGGYAERLNNVNTTTEIAGQFTPGDHRSLDKIVQDLTQLGYIPSFCTACYRLGRTGEDFMCLAKPGIIKNMCGPNALITFQEYLNDYASPTTRAVGEKLVAQELAQIPETQRKVVLKMFDELKKGKRDLFV